MSKRYSKCDYSDFLARNSIKIQEIAIYHDSNGQECLMILNAELDYGKKIERLARDISESELTAQAVRDLKAKATGTAQQKR